jgi:hypothetical protein
MRSLNFTAVILITLVVGIVVFFAAAPFIISYITSPQIPAYTSACIVPNCDVPVTEFGYGLLKFESAPKMIGKDVSTYLGNHPNLKLVSISSQEYAGGYWIIVENRSVCNV